MSNLFRILRAAGLRLGYQVPFHLGGGGQGCENMLDYKQIRSLGAATK